MMKTPINPIVKTIIEEAKTKEGTDIVGKIYSVCREVDAEIITIIDSIQSENRKKGKKNG